MNEALANLLSVFGNVFAYGFPAILAISLAVVFVREWRRVSKP
jgi:hypothetical protein